MEVRLVDIDAAMAIGCSFVEIRIIHLDYIVGSLWHLL